MKKGSSLGNTVVRNKQLSISSTDGDSQRCNGRGCLQCPLTNTKSKIVVNGNVVRIPRHLNCRSRNVIYMWICKLCGEKEVYFGRTIQNKWSQKLFQWGGGEMGKVCIGNACLGNASIPILTGEFYHFCCEESLSTTIETRRI